MGSIGKIISTKISDFIIYTLESRLGYKIEAASYSPAGIDAPGLPDDKAFIVKKDGSGKYVALGTLNVSQGAEAGELILYSRDSDGENQAKIYLKKDGKVSINDGSTEAARNGDAVQVTIPAGTFIVSVSGGSGAPAVGVLNPAPIDVDGTIQEGTGEVLLP